MVNDLEKTKYFKILIPLSCLMSFVIYMLINAHYGSEQALSYLCGAGLSLVNIVALAYVLKILFAQKSVAWAVVLIVSKYPILGLIILYLAQKAWFYTLYFCAGFGSILIVAILVAAFSKLKVKADANS
tara:strand:- start:1467 stop:1853 length:387 start_codon:yes stop_codon:yes gene_type:complete